MKNIDVFLYDCDESLDELVTDLIKKRQGKVSYFYEYDTEGDDLCAVVSDQELTAEEVENAGEKELGGIEE